MNTQIRGLQIKDSDITVLQLANDAVETAKIKDKNVTLAKLEDGASAQLVVVGAGGVPAYQDVSGDVTISNVGATAIGATKVVDAMINDDVATGLAGTGLTATAGVLSVDTIADNIVEADIQVENFSADVDVSGYAGEHTLANAPIVNSVQVFLNGLMQEEGSGKDYTLTASVIQFATEPISGDIILVHYIIND